MNFAVVFYFFVAFHFDNRAVVQGKAVGRVLKIFLFDQNTLKSFWVKTECGASLQAFLMSVQIDVLEFFEREVSRNIRRLGN